MTIVCKKKSKSANNKNENSFFINMVMYGKADITHNEIGVM